MKTLFLLVILFAAVINANKCLCAGEELILNGSFDNDFDGFYSQYTLVKNPPWSMNGIYTTTNDPKKYFSGWMSFEDISPSDNNIMFLNDAGNNTKLVLIGTNVSVKKNSNYLFSCWVASVHNIVPPKIKVLINDEFQIDRQIPDKGGEWVNITFEWCSLNFDNAKIEIFNDNPSLYGNDFVVDEISFKETESNETIDFEKADDVSICPFTSIEIGKYSNPNLKYSWFPTRYLSNSNIANPICKPDSSIRYIVTITAGGCNKLFDTIDVTVHKTKKPVITASSLYLCNDSVVLTGNDGFSSYRWSTGEVGKQITVRQKGVYKLTVIDSNGCETSNQITIYDKLSEIKIPDVIYVGELCYGAKNPDVTYFIDNNTSDTIYFEKFELTTGLDFFKLIDENEPKQIFPKSQYAFKIELKDLAVGFYRGVISYKIIGDCIKEGKIFVEAKIVEFEIDLKDTLFICSGTPTNIGRDDVKDNEYYWVPEVYLDDPYTSNPVCTPFRNMKYYVVVKNKINGCIGFDTVDVIVSNSELKIKQQFSKCKDSVTLSINEGFIEYEWSNGGTDNSIVIDKSGKYIVKALDSNGCVAIDTIDVVIRPQQVDITASHFYLCQGPITLTASDGYVEYIWSNGQNGQSIVVDKAGQYKVIAIDSIGCTAESTYIVNDYVYNIEFPNTIDLGDICYGKMLLEDIFNIRNLSNDSLIIDTLYFNSDFFEVEYDINHKMIYPNSQFPFKINLLNLPIGQISGYLKFAFKYPCYEADSIFVKANIIIQSLDLPDSLWVCLGSSIKIGVESDNPDHKYIWSPSDYLDNPNVSNPLSTPPSNIRYFVKRTDKLTGCIALDTVDVLIHNSQIEISASALTVCQDSVELTASDGYSIYNWSNGQKGRIIKIKEAGKYSVTAIDSNGCESYAEIEIGIHKINLEFPDKIDFGTICLGSSLSREINITNIENEKVVIDSIHLINNENFQISIPLDNNDTLNQGDSYSFQVLSKFINAGYHENEIRISFKYPCPAEYRIKLSANVFDNKIHIFLPDTTVFIGDSICIPVSAYSECPDNELIANYQMTVSVNKSLFKPDSVTTGKIISITELNKDFQIVFEDRTNTKTITTDVSIINYLCGLVLLGEVKSSILNIEDFEFVNPITIYKKNGSIATDICALDIRQIQMITPNKFEILQNDYSDKIILNTGSGEEGSFSIKIMDLTGNTIYNYTWQKSNKLYEEKFIPVNSINFSQGVYMILFQTPWSIKTGKLLIMN